MAAAGQITIEARALMACLPLFAGLRGETLARLGRTARLIELPGHRAVFSAGQPIREAHFLASGSVKRFIMRSDNVEKVLELAQPGSLFALGETFAADTYGSFAETVKPSVMLALGKGALHDAAAQDALLSLRLLQAVAAALHAGEFSHQQHRALSVTQRVLDYLLEQAGDRRRLAGETTVQLGVSKRLIAARLDMAPETFSRTLRQLSEDGRIVVEGRAVHIQNATLVAEERAVSDSPLAVVRYPRHERGRPQPAHTPVELVNLCGRFRMLAHQAASAWLVTARCSSPPPIRMALRKYRTEFARKLSALARLDWPHRLAEKRGALASAWDEFTAVIGAQEPGLEQAREVFVRSEAAYAAADSLTQAIVSTTGGDSVGRVNRAGRNRMLCARVAKLALFAGTGVMPAEIGRLLAESKAEFQRNLEGLRTASAGHPEVRAQLTLDVEEWQVFLEAIDAAGPGVHEPDRALKIFHAVETVLRHGDTTVKIFEKLAV